MKSLLREALEDQESSPNPAEQAAIILKGPLSEVYTQALYLSHAKVKPKEEGEPTPEPEGEKKEQVTAVMETIQIDQTLIGHMANLVNPTNGQLNAPPPQSVYAVTQRGVDENVVVELTRELAAAQPKDRRGDFIVVVDATIAGADSMEGQQQEKYLRMMAALEGLCEAHGVPIYHSLGEYLQTRA